MMMRRGIIPLLTTAVCSAALPRLPPQVMCTVAAELSLSDLRSFVFMNRDASECLSFPEVVEAVLSREFGPDAVYYSVLTRNPRMDVLKLMLERDKRHLDATSTLANLHDEDDDEFFSVNGDIDDGIDLKDVEATSVMRMWDRTLQAAVYGNSPKAVDMLLQHPREYSKEGYDDALNIGAEYNKLDAVKVLTSQRRFDQATINNAFALAAIGNHVGVMMHFLIQESLRPDQEGIDAAFSACARQNQPDVMDWLGKHAHVSLIAGHRTVINAASANQFRVVIDLLIHRRWPFLTPVLGEALGTVYIYAAKFEQVMILKRLEELQPMADAVVASAAVEAAAHGSLESIMHLVHGRDLDQELITELFIAAAQSSHANIVQYLIKRFGISNQNMRIIIGTAAEHGHIELILMVLEPAQVAAEKATLVKRFSKRYQCYLQLLDTAVRASIMHSQQVLLEQLSRRLPTAYRREYLFGAVLLCIQQDKRSSFAILMPMVPFQYYSQLTSLAVQHRRPEIIQTLVASGKVPSVDLATLMMRFIKVQHFADLSVILSNAPKTTVFSVTFSKALMGMVSASSIVWPLVQEFLTTPNVLDHIVNVALHKAFALAARNGRSEILSTILTTNRIPEVAISVALREAAHSNADAETITLLTAARNQLLSHHRQSN